MLPTLLTITIFGFLVNCPEKCSLSLCNLKFLQFLLLVTSFKSLFANQVIVYAWTNKS